MGYGRPPPRRSDYKAWLKRNIGKPATAAYNKYILEDLFRQKPLPPSKDGRHVPLHPSRKEPLVDERRGYAYISNSIRSSRYTIYNFIPKQFWFQATRLSNFYFICVGVPQTIPGLSTTGNFTTILPLMFFMLLTIVKEGYDDWRRHRLDKVENRSLATVVRRRDEDVARETRASVAWKGISGSLPVPWKKKNDDIDQTKEGDILEEDSEDDTLCWRKTQWQHIRVGNVLRLTRDDPVPADIVLLHASGEDGMAYIDTMALDGETSLKSRQAPAATRCCANIAGIKAIDAEAVIEDPNRDLHNFDGRLTVNGQIRPLTLADVILRGSVLRNTALAIGLVVNTGEECKIRMNANHHPKAKKPRLERYANQVVLTLIVYVILLSVGCAMGYLMWQNETENKSWYISSAPVSFAEIIVGYLIMFNNVIPLAMYVSLEIVKLGQQLLIASDAEMYDEETDTPMRVNTNTILENLGQVGYLLSDKTGTLTENVMKFRKLSIAGTIWTHGGMLSDAPRASVSIVPRMGKAPGGAEPSIEVRELAGPEDMDKHLKPPVARRSSSQPRRASSEQAAINNTAQLIEYIKTNPSTPFARKARDYILGMALCHTCLPETAADGSIDFQASSPDELALARAARDLGHTVVSRSTHSITLLCTDAGGQERKEVYEILDIVEFSSKRKRMSIVLRCPDGKIWLLCKGADSVLIPRLKQHELANRKSKEVRRSVETERELQRRSLQTERKSGVGERPSMAIERVRKSMDLRPSIDRGRIEYQHPSFDRLRVPSFDRKPGDRAPLDTPPIYDDAEIFTRCFKHLDEFATDGLRTLLFAHKVISEADYSAWKRLYLDATTSLANRQERVEAAGDIIEQDLDLLGASAIEDKLQKGVPETIDKLRRANIRIWMLTGDKRETAINIAHSARICRPESYVFVFDSSKGDLAGQLQSAFDEVLTGSVHSVAVIDGTTLSVVDEDAALHQLFYSLIFQLDSVICCRASPAQKASIVRAIPSYIPKALTCAIGDGANDIAMIQAADVGVGLSGKEGLQASRVADYSISQFRFLQRLLLVHGRWNYIRTAKFVLWTFWKEMMFYMMQALYQRYNGYTGTSLYENWSLTALNTLFTSLCCIVPGMFEQDLRAETLLAVPELYVYGQRNQELNLGRYLLWMVNAAAEGMVLWFVPWALYGKHSFMSDNGLFALGDLVFSLAIVWTNVKLL